MNDNPGYKTTEFWLTLAAAIMIYLKSSVSQHWVTQVVGVAGIILAAFGYNAGRAYVKGKRLTTRMP